MKNTFQNIIEQPDQLLISLNEIKGESLYRFSNGKLDEYGIFSKDLYQNLKELKKLGGKKQIPILITGATGAGKEVIAKYIHYEVDHNEGPYIALNCSNVNKEMFEAELFGYNKGAFTGARQDGKKGYIELSENGTLFLDEITEIEQDVQVKLLRVLQEREYFRLGGNKKLNVNSRIIGATNRDIKRLVEQGDFREDLFYRLNIVQIYVPGLKNRKQEIIPLLGWFIDSLNKQFGKNVKYVENKVLKLLYHYDWPGNIRELKNLITQVMIFIESDTIRFDHLRIKDELDRLQTEQLSASSKLDQYNKETVIEKLLEQPINIEKFTMDIVRTALKKFDGNKTKTAKYLGLKREQLYNRFKLN